VRTPRGNIDPGAHLAAEDTGAADKKEVFGVVQAASAMTARCLDTEFSQ
jgi:hypothetical protein